MDKLKIKQLAKFSFKDNQLDEVKVKKISQLLNRTHLKGYIKNLKAIERKQTIVLVVPDDKIGNVSTIVGQISKLYPGKRILIKTDPSLIAGMRIVNDDLIYEVSMKQILNDAIKAI